jgi:hypothetical protein
MVCGGVTVRKLFRALHQRDYKTPFEYIGEYSNAVGRYGPDSEQTQQLRALHADNTELIAYFDSLDRLKRHFGGMGMKLPETMRDAEVEVMNQVYQATQVLESLADAGKLDGNGHHIRQAAARLVGDLLKVRWREEKPLNPEPYVPPYGEGGPGSDTYMSMRD